MAPLPHSNDAKSSITKNFFGNVSTQEILAPKGIQKWKELGFPEPDKNKSEGAKKSIILCSDRHDYGT